MKNLRTLLTACALVAGLAACGDSSAPLAPESALFNGFTGGSGNYMSTDTTSTFDDNGHTAGSGNRSATTTTTSDGTTVERNGHTAGSGN